MRRAVPSLGAAILMLAAAACGSDTPGPGPSPTAVSVTAVSPATGSTFGGTTVTITGAGFVSGASVLIGGTAATDVVIVNSTSITAKTPAHVAGAGDVLVAVGTRSSSLPLAFTFVTPSASPNSEPIVGAISVTPPRDKQPKTLATIGDRVTLTASVNDSETPLNALTIEWSALPSIGTFSGTGASVQWTAPGSTSSPQTVVLMLTVIERYQQADSSGLPVQREHRVQRTVNVRVHDTVREVSDMAIDFLTLFSNSSLGPEAVLHNFSKTCDGGEGYAAEYADVVESRATREILTHEISAPTKFEWGFGEDTICTGTRKTTAGDVCVSIPVKWTDRAIGSSATDSVSGVDFVSAAYEDTRWRLCHSKWEAFSTLTGKPVQMDFDRHRIIKGPKEK